MADFPTHTQERHDTLGGTKTSSTSKANTDKSLLIHPKASAGARGRYRYANLPAAPQTTKTATTFKFPQPRSRPCPKSQKHLPALLTHARENIDRVSRRYHLTATTYL